MATSERKKRALKFLARNNIVNLVIVGLFAIFAPKYLPVGQIAADQAEQAADQRVQEHCDKHGGC